MPRVASPRHARTFGRAPWVVHGRAKRRVGKNAVFDVRRTRGALRNHLTKSLRPHRKTNTETAKINIYRFLDRSREDATPSRKILWHSD
jgi:hypothetical protein